MSDTQFITGFFCLILGVLAVVFLLASVLIARSGKRKTKECCGFRDCVNYRLQIYCRIIREVR